VQLTFLRPLYADAGVFASVYIETSRASEDARKAIPLRWRDMREELSRYGADAATLDALGALITSPETTAPGTAAFGRSGTVPFSAALPAPPLRELARWARLPHLMPLLAQSPPRAPHLLVSANRAGGEVLAVRTSDDVLKETVEGTGWPVHKTKVGGWSQLEHQRSVEEAWEENARELAAAVASAARPAEIEAVIVAGDVRARKLLVDKLPTELRRKAVVVDREVDVESAAVAEAADEVLRALAEQDCRRRLESFRSQLGAGRATEGLPETVAALRDGQVSDLFLAGDYLGVNPDVPGPAWGTVPAWIGPGLADIGLSEADLRERGVTDLAEDRADAAIVRAAAGTDAGIYFVPADEAPPREDIGALLRYAAPGA
jgi:hypothetical protein